MVELIATPEGSGTLSFPRYGWPQSRGFGPWSLTAVDAETGLPVDTPHARLTADSTLQGAEDGSLRVVVAAQLPDGIPESNWIQIPPDRPYRLVFRFYAPGPLLEAGDWFPPPLSRSE
ncbi:MAG: DUF1214 domain-containing protein [Deltaproteobacteria bacterium]|nr:DUF1214 domain-containing protein [Deltaproteobacteria bacterium]